MSGYQYLGVKISLLLIYAGMALYYRRMERVSSMSFTFTIVFNINKY